MGPVNTWPPHPGLGTWQQESGTCAPLSNTPLSSTGSHRVVGEAALPVRVSDVEVEGAAAEVLGLQQVPGAAEPARVPVQRSPVETKVIRRFAKVSIVSYSCPSLMIIASVSQFHIHLPWGQRPSSIVS